MSVAAAPVPMLQHEQEFDRLLELYRERAPRRVLEVGTYHGGTLYHWLQNATPGATVVTIDSYATGIDNSALYHSWAAPDVQFVVIRGDSNDIATAAAAQAHGPYDWIYIDADHHLAAVRADWQLYSRLAAPGALVVLHDISESSDPSIQVAAFWAEMHRWYRTTEITEPGGFGIGIAHMP